MRGGYWGRILRVNLTNGRIITESISEDLYKTYLGDEGLAAKILYDEVPNGSDPLGRENVLVFAVGPFQGGSKIIGSGRFTVAAKSPLTGIFGQSGGGAYIGEELKKTGFDAVIIKGKSPLPVYLWIHDGRAEIKDASHLWGKKDTFETEDAIRDELSDNRVQVLSIGIAGETLVRYAAIISGKGHGVAGRTGMGTVMGSKYLKALAFRGTQKVPIARENELNTLKKDIAKRIREDSSIPFFRKYGQAITIVPREQNGLLPIKNFQMDCWPEGAMKIGAGEGQGFNETLNPKPDSCSNCVIGCHRRVTVKSGKYSMDSYGPEYETLGMMGSNCLIDDLPLLNWANEMCNRWGIDTIDFGGCCAFAMEAYEYGKITKHDLGGIVLKWGDGEAMIKLLEKVVKREGKVPWLLGEGLRIAGKELDCMDMALHVNGAAVPAHDPRAFLSMAVAESTSMKGGSHLHGCPECIEVGITFPEADERLNNPMEPHSAKNKGLAAAKYQDRMAISNSLVFCCSYESIVNFTDLTVLLNAITGWDLFPRGLLEIGERIVCLEHMFNLKNGLDPIKDYWLPARFLKPHERGGAAGIVPPLREMIEEYFEVKGWPAGIPTADTLSKLGLEFCRYSINHKLMT